MSRTFLYVIDLDERGDFRAHVEDHRGDVAFSFSADDETGEVWLIEDGFMNDANDLDGLREYLVSVGIMGEGDHLTDDPDDVDDDDDDDDSEEWED